MPTLSKANFQLPLDVTLGRNKNLATSLNKTYNVTRAEKTFNRDRSTGVAKSCVSK